MAPHAAMATNLSLKSRLGHFTWMMGFLTLYMGGCAFNFGYDVGNFAGVQGMQSFGKRFGTCDASTGICSLPSWLSSIMTSVPFIGKALGAVSCGWIAERYGRRLAVLCLVILSFIGVLLQTSATTAAQFTVGRFISFGMTGMTIVVVPIYIGETAPRELRGMMTSTLQLMISLGQLVAALVNWATEPMSSDSSWMIPVSLQFIAPAIILALLPFMPESPRWLLSQDRVDQAALSLRRLRPKTTEADIEIEMAAMTSDQSSASSNKGTWGDVFNKDNRARTLVAVVAMFGQQITGQAFQSQYGVVFYQKQGFGDQAFLFNIIANIIGLVCLLITWVTVDGLGRRPLLLFGGSLMGCFLMVVGGISTIAEPTHDQKGAMVASLMLFGAAYSLSWAPIAYVTVGEAAASNIREKTNLLAGVISILTTFVTSFTIPYLMDEPYAALGGQIGFVYGAINFVMVLVAFFLIPELKGRSLEEVDQLFQSGVPFRRFGQVETTVMNIQEGDKEKEDEENLEGEKEGPRVVHREE